MIRPLLLLFLASCATLDPEARANTVEGPPQDRCVAIADALQRDGCARARDKIQTTIAGLTREDQLCLEPAFDSDLTNCRARASIDDQDVRGLKLRFIDVQPGSAWTSYANLARWFDDGALVDLYLKERGF